MGFYGFLREITGFYLMCSFGNAKNRPFARADYIIS